MHGRIGIISFVVVAFLAGCSEVRFPTAAEQNELETPLAQSFDRAQTGTIRGRVLWDGDIPVSQEFLVRAIAFNPNLHQNPARYFTPHIPNVDQGKRGVADAIVYLRGIDPRRSRAWDHGKVRVEFRERQLLVQQGDQRTGVGFVHRGSAIEIMNADGEYHNLHARGAAFFSMPLLEVNRVHERTFPQSGVVDLTCAAGYYWLHAHLFVAEHPYYTRTGADGQFSLDHVPTGMYEIVCWLPSWHVTRKEIDPETAITARLAWARPQEQAQMVQVRAGQMSEIPFSWTGKMFAQTGQ
jgi:hypothetical protein